MNDWKSVLKADPTEWLLEGDNPSLRFSVLKDLLGEDEKNPEVVKAGREVANSPEVQRILAGVNSNGGPFWSTADGSIWLETSHNTTIFSLSALAGLGLPHQHPTVAQACEFVFSHQTREGFFESAGERWPCYAAFILRFLCRFGLSQDKRVLKTYQWMRPKQRADGGWYCEESAIGWTGEELDSCPFAVLNVLSAFAEVEEWRTSPEAIPAVEFLLKHWETKKPIPDVPMGRYGIGPRWQKVRFPLFGYDMLNYADVLSRYQYALADPRFKQVVELLLSQQDREGRWVVTWPYAGWEDFEFGRKDSPSKWATLSALRVVRRFYS